MKKLKHLTPVGKWLKKHYTLGYWLFAISLLLLATNICYDYVSTKDDPFLSFINEMRIGEKTWDWLAFFIAFLSLIVAILTTYFQRKTERNTTRVDEECQRQILFDLTRHFYMNLIVVCALEAKLRRRYDKYYPSEEHFEKLKISLDPQIFKTQADKFQSIHELMVMLENYNKEIDVIRGHLSSPNVIDEAKDRDFSTLRFKMSFLTMRVSELMKQIWGKDYKTEIAKTISTGARKRNVNPKDKAGSEAKINEAAAKWDHARPYYDNSASFYRTLFTPKADNEKKKQKQNPDIMTWEEFVERLNTQIYIEMTWKNSDGGEKLYFIPFNKTDGPFPA